jgi:hypothetical protein
MPDPHVLAELLVRAQTRREQDLIAGPVHNIEPGGIPNPHYRAQAMITYAYSIRSHRFYVGYSGSSGGIVDKNKDLADHNMAWRRHERISGDIDAYEEYFTERSPYNCGEAAAYSIAASWGEQLRDLVFASFGLEGQLVDPCVNCQLWLERAYGCRVGGGALTR